MIKIKNFECSKSIRSYEKSNAWNIKRLVGGSFGQTNDRSIVLFHKLSDFYTANVYRGLRGFYGEIRVRGFQIYGDCMLPAFPAIFLKQKQQ